MRSRNDLQRNLYSRFSIDSDAGGGEDGPLTDARGASTSAEVVDRKLKAALLRARSLMFRSPVWPVEFESVDAC